MNDILTGVVIEPEQTLRVLGGDGYVAIEYIYPEDKVAQPDAVLLMRIPAAERLALAITKAANLAREATEADS
ncbi:hypothetical protein FZI85_10280 [Mycobacterium sp. CBMA293]|uniref:hypothetical protein n=1 Tax=unclassified Mycolicibacterium TaxID=2636767 RepID=UPI0012DD1847|nr:MULTISPECIES: hypothetical protein [unclassified Mycolicibacterium]MUL49268.1 hypothetical protein [Mycolicibacterium sp. CBMA 360]MUL58926.1 hypothetical protein [Mycolicibacterium sp. CBMA 335]MUL69320.1 hypothetical protein [Mycolicibacterium sp. CBMA 311]MUL94284.1 hypothetical protein [Mycolicibacterium sp. CBMA 230]MUM04056.1 hypothetical protein [Mycolicibacterium sp. CBMA 213]